jgi:monoamine oxidase
VGDVAPEDPDNYFNAGPGRIPQHHARVLDYCKELGVELQPFVYMDKANLMQNDAWNGGRPVQARRLKNDLRGHLAELMAKISDQGALDQLISPADMEAFLQMLKHFGQLTGEGAQMVYAGAALKSDYIRAGYRVEMGDITQAGEPWPTLSLDEVLGSDFWRSEMFNDLEYFWQTSLLEAKDGMDMIWKAFLPAKVGSGIADTVENLISVKQPVVAIDLTEQGVNVTTVSGDRHAADYVVVTIPPDLVAKIGGNFLPDRTRATFAAVQIAPACKVGLQAKSRFWEQEDRMYGGISWTKHIISQIWYPNYSFNSPTGVLTAAYNNSQPAAEFGTLNRQARIAETLAGGERLHPGYTDKVFHTNAASIAWQNMPYQSGGWANDTAFSQPEIFSEMVTASHIKERVFMAGDWFSYWPGWQEGALDSAHLASDQIARAALRSR